MKILLIKLNKIGDVLLTSPMFLNLKNHFKNCQIDILVNYGTEGILDTTHLNKIHTLKRHKNPLLRLKSEISLLYAIQKEKYDIVFGLMGGERTAFLSFWSGAKVKVGFPPSSFWAKNIYTHKLSYKSQHNIQSNLDALRILDIKITSIEVLPPKLQSSKKLENLPKNFIHLHFFSDWSYKCLNPKFYAKLLDFIIEAFKIPCILTASNNPQEIANIQEIKKFIKNEIIIFEGNLSLKEVSLLNSKALAFIGVDTSIMHLSAANNTPTFAFFGPSFADFWGPWDNSLKNCTYEHKGGLQKMGKHQIYQEELSCVPCGRSGCEDSLKSDCLLSKFNEEKALKAVSNFLKPLIQNLEA
ncbi:heptosyltransferase [Helicobacter valdiviensis]|uniref:Heptosyltransferase n=1 Tax=Helicobacter valdiviensis TaxID=1458358 RepID=A0A2W6NL31_9HELI|nr:glycosyltransferase family 9 protein [Helicobacter valdiviensis]PZT48136.1 heptosyltransferase [Helicobacter valdiviensis]